MKCVQKNGIAGVLLHQASQNCPSCGHLEVHFFKDLDTWKYTNDEAVKMFKDDFVKMYCGNDDCQTVFAIKPSSIYVEWEIYTKVEEDK